MPTTTENTKTTITSSLHPMFLQKASIFIVPMSLSTTTHHGTPHVSCNVLAVSTVSAPSQKTSTITCSIHRNKATRKYNSTKTHLSRYKASIQHSEKTHRYIPLKKLSRNSIFSTQTSPTILTKNSPS